MTFSITSFSINRVGFTWWMASDQLSVYLPLNRRDMEIMMQIEQLPEAQTLHVLLYGTEPVYFTKVRLLIEKDRDGMISLQRIEPVLNEYDLLEPLMPSEGSPDIEELKEQLKELKAAKKDNIQERRFEVAARIRDQEKQLELLLKRLQKGWDILSQQKTDDPKAC